MLLFKWVLINQPRHSHSHTEWTSEWEKILPHLPLRLEVPKGTRNKHHRTINILLAIVKFILFLRTISKTGEFESFPQIAHSSINYDRNKGHHHQMKRQQHQSTMENNQKNDSQLNLFISSFILSIRCLFIATFRIMCATSSLPNIILLYSSRPPVGAATGNLISTRNKS